MEKQKKRDMALHMDLFVVQCFVVAINDLVQYGGKMHEVYLTAIPLRSMRTVNKETKVERIEDKTFYETKNYENAVNIKSRFPIVPIINMHRGSMYDKTIIAVRTQNQDTDFNMTVLHTELEELGEFSGGEPTIVDIFESEDQMEIVSGKFFKKIVDVVPDESLIYADITYGSKPMSALMLYVLSFIEKVKDVEVRGIYYGEIKRSFGKTIGAYSYDLTKIMRISNAVESLDALGISDKMTVLTKLFEL